MADDPHRDLLPVKESSCINTCRSSIIDSRERHAVCKLDRYQLEDRYLRLLDEVQDLKKLSNTQEDKIKRLATKLMRVAATPRSCYATTLDFNNDRNRVERLEHENAKLKDKITVLRNQILNHKIGRSSSRSRKLPIYPSSGPTTSRSEIGRGKSSSLHLIGDIEDEKDRRNYLATIEELEIQIKEMTSRIAELEGQLENHQIDKQREKAAENIEFIRVWRQMKQQCEQLVSAQAINASLTAQIRDLKELLEEKTRNIKEMTGALMTEKKKLIEIDEQLAKAKRSQLSLREKDEEIKDLMSEMRILHQHNAELIALSSKYSQVEQENIELKKKISEQLSDHQSLKSAFSNEQSNITALQAVNEQLMGKLHDLQKNIDSLTIQLKSFQSQNERRERSEPELRIVRTVDRETNTNSLSEKRLAPSEKSLDLEREICKNCCQVSRERRPKSESKNLVNREMQTEDDSMTNLRDVRRDEFEKRSPKRVTPQSPMRADRSFQPANGSASLMPEEMLKLLEQAQINTSLDVLNAPRTREFASTLPNEYFNSTELSQTQRENSVKCAGFENLGNCITRMRHRLNKITETSQCTRREDKTCNGKDDRGYSCDQAISKQELVGFDDELERYQCNLIRNPFRNVVSDISTCIQNTFDNIHMSRIIRGGGTLGECYKSWQTPNAMRNSMSGSPNEKDLTICKNAQWNFSSEQTKDSELTKSSEVIPNDSPCTRCCNDYRGKEFSTKTGSSRNSLNTQVKKQLGSSRLLESVSRDRKNIENRTSVLPKERSGQCEELVKSRQVDNKNRIDKALLSQQSKSSGVIRSTQGDSSILGRPLGISKNNESRRESTVDSYLSTSLEQSDSSVIRAMEDEDATSEDIRNAGKKRQNSCTEKLTKNVETGLREDSTEKVDSESIDEFNSLIRNSTILSPRESSSSVQDLGNVFSDDNWHEYKRRSMASQARFSRPSIAMTDDKSGASYIFADKVSRNNNAVIIRIESLSLDHQCPLLEDPEIHQLYVEFSFLGYHGVDLETVSVPKPTANTTAYFNYMRKFEIDEEKHQMQRSIMRAMMTDDDNPTVKFTIVSEPLPKEMETEECMEVGYAYLNIREHVLSGGSNEVPLTIVNVKQTEPIGTLKITLLGAEAIRRCISDLV